MCGGKKTMKDLSELARECVHELEEIGIHPASAIAWKVNTRAKKRWGCCKNLPDGSFEISISKRLLSDDVQNDAAKNTVIHELLHTVKGCTGHTGKWKQLACSVKEKLGYDIKRTSSCAEKGIAESDPPKRKYLLICQGCKGEIWRQRASSLITHPERYRCAVCGQVLVRAIVAAHKTSN